MMKRETTPLLSPSNASGKESSYYFLNKATESYQGGTTESVRDHDGGEEIEEVPAGATNDEFAPRTLEPVMHNSQHASSRRAAAPANGGGFFSFLFGKKSNPTSSDDVGSLMKIRKAPVKIEPKVFFANERTFLAWMHLSVVLAGASIAILAFAEESNPMGQLYGVILLPVAISFILYSMVQYARRANMIRHRHPGPYEDTVGPTVLGVMLMLSILAQFSLKLYSMH